MSASVPETASEIQPALAFARRKIYGGLPATQRKSMVRFLTMLLNDSPRAHRLAKMFGRGEIDGDTLLELIG
ncbi:MAG: hypothetical protein K0M58_04615 [Thiobacillus sp.]|nr:hypothetical protein [Thiobacillus sp.]